MNALISQTYILITQTAKSVWAIKALNEIKTSLILTSCPTLRTCVVCQKRLFLPSRYFCLKVLKGKKLRKKMLPIL